MLELLFFFFQNTEWSIAKILMGVIWCKIPFCFIFFFYLFFFFYHASFDGLMKSTNDMIMCSDLWLNIFIFFLFLDKPIEKVANVCDWIYSHIITTYMWFIYFYYTSTPLTLTYEYTHGFWSESSLKMSKNESIFVFILFSDFEIWILFYFITIVIWLFSNYYGHIYFWYPNPESMVFGYFFPFIRWKIVFYFFFIFIVSGIWLKEINWWNVSENQSGFSFV